MSAKKIEAIHQQLLAGATLDYATALKIEAADGKRFSKKELAANLAIEKDRVAGLIKFDERGADRFFDVLKQVPQGRFSAFVEGFKSGATLGAKIGGAVTGTAAGVTALTAGFAGGPAAAVSAAGVAALGAAIPGSVVGAGVGGVAEGAWFAIRD